MPWIWLDEKKYPGFQQNFVSVNGVVADERNKSDGFKYCVAEFEKSLDYEKEIDSVKLKVSADSFFVLYVNGELKGVGPAAAGGDFLCTGTAPKHYMNCYDLPTGGNSLSIFARVRLLPEVLTDYSRGHGGFFLAGEVIFKDGSVDSFETDSSWLSRANASYDGFQSYNGEKESGKACESQIIRDIWNAEEAPIPMLSLNRIVEESAIKAEPGETVSKRMDFDRIYGVYPSFRADGSCRISVKMSELEGQNVSEETIVFSGKDDYFSFRMHSAGTALVSVENTDSKPVRVFPSFIAPWYPVNTCGEFKTNNDDLNKIYDVCRHTLKICRQTLHLDSTKHQELLACTGDYYIESLMTLFCFGDMRLAEFDLKRTADVLVQSGGLMFHTTYSLIWVQMLRDVYMITGRKDTLKYCRKALDTLLNRFESYMGGNGVIDNPPDYMFVDWTVIDGFSMHHPPKALGQTVLNAFYYMALTAAGEVYDFLGDAGSSKTALKKAQKLKICFNEVFFDSERRLYFDGLGTPCGGDRNYHPKNVDKRYYSKYPNILAALSGLADDSLSVEILDRIIPDDTLGDIQPYFMHYLLCAVRKHGLFEKHGMKLLERWTQVVKECDKGLKEGWIAPEASYSFDHSHAWGGTPAYQMPMAITGLEILEPGMKKLKFSPNLYGLEYADILIPTESGTIEFKAQKGEEAVIIAPPCIEIIRGGSDE